MKRIQLYLNIIMIPAMVLISSSLDAQSGREIMEKSREVSRMVGMEAVSTLTILDAKGRERIRQTSMASKLFGASNTEKRIIRFLAPADVKGTGMLIFDYDDKNDDMWIYMPALRKTRRIVSTEKSKSFMGSEFSNADMSAPRLDDFNYELLGSEQVDGVSCWKINVIPVNEDIMDDMGFDRKTIWIGKEDYVPRKAEYFDEDDELVKVMIAKDVKLLDPNGKKYLATNMVMDNVQNGRRSVMIMNKVQFNPNVGDQYFTVDYLEKL
jgi:hypothetical protein